MNASKEHPEDVTCSTCDGSGYNSAARQAGYTAENMLTANPMTVPIGTWPCESCGGTGKLIDGEKLSQLKEYIGDNKELIENAMLTEKTKRKD